MWQCENDLKFSRGCCGCTWKSWYPPSIRNWNFLEPPFSFSLILCYLFTTCCCSVVNSIFSTLIHAFVVYSTASSTNYQSVDFLPRRSIFSSVAFDILISLSTFPFIQYWWGNSSGEWLSSKWPKNSDEYRFSDTLYQAQRYFTLSFLRFLGCGKVFRIWIT